MVYSLLRPLSPPLERRYDGPVPLSAPPARPATLLDRLAAESRGLAAGRRRQVTAGRLAGDDVLARHVHALAWYRAQALLCRMVP